MKKKVNLEFYITLTLKLIIIQVSESSENVIAYQHTQEETQNKKSD